MIYIKIGQIVNTHGNRGEVKIYPLTDDINRFYTLSYVYIQVNDVYYKYNVNGARLHKGMAILDFKEIPDMNEAEKLKGAYVELPETELLPLEEGHYYIFQLIGLDVYENQIHIGRLKDIFATGSNDVYVIAGNKKDIYLPATKEVIKEIDLDAGRMQVEIPLGLLD